MNTTMLNALLFAAVLAAPVTANADVCQAIAAGGTVKIEDVQSTSGCTATLTKDTTIEGSAAGRIVAGTHGVVIKLNGHKLTVKALSIDFQGDFAIAVHGNNQSSDVVTFDGVKIKDLSSISCAGAKDRVGAVMWKVKTANLAMNVENGKVRYGLVVGAPMPGQHTPPEQQGTAVVAGSIPYCQGAWSHGDRAILAFERAVTWSGGEVESVGPCDFEAAMLKNLRDHGTPGGA